VYGRYLPVCPAAQANPTSVRQRRRLSIGQLCGPCLLSRSAEIWFRQAVFERFGVSFREVLRGQVHQKAARLDETTLWKFLYG
jgi:hypothetical protein